MNRRVALAFSVVWPPLAGVVALLGVWEAGVRVFAVPSYALPPPSQVAVAFVQVRSVLPEHVLATVRIAAGGLLLGTLAAIVIAATLAAVPLLRRSMQPLLVASQSVPSVVLAPILVALFGFGTLPRLLVVALVVVFPVAVATLDGLRSADAELVGLVRSMGAGRARLLWWVRVPHALGSLFSGLRIAAAYAMFGAIVAEWMGAERGLGVYFNRVRTSYRMDRVIVAIVVIAAVSIALYALVTALGRLATPWLHPDLDGDDAVADETTNHHPTNHRPTNRKQP